VFSTQGHSGQLIRKGVVVSAPAREMSKDDFKLMGLWDNDAVMLCINENEASQFNNKLRQLANTNARTAT
jgi:hypothetical protein